jgi:hypothetical protein
MDETRFKQLYFSVLIPDGREKWTEVEEACAARWLGRRGGRQCMHWWEREVDY